MMKKEDFLPNRNAFFSAIMKPMDSVEISMYLYMWVNQLERLPLILYLNSITTNTAAGTTLRIDAIVFDDNITLP